MACCEGFSWIGKGACHFCSECMEDAGHHLETLDIKDNGGAYRPCEACIALEKLPKATIQLKKEVEPHSSTGFVYRAYELDGTPLYLGDEDQEKLAQRVFEALPHKNVTVKYSA